MVKARTAHLQGVSVIFGVTDYLLLRQLRKPNYGKKAKGRGRGVRHSQS